MRNLQLFTTLIILLIPMQNGIVQAAEMTPFADCKSISESGYELTFIKLTERAPQGWCRAGKGMVRILHNEKLFMAWKTDWDTCSMSGFRIQNDYKGYAVTIREGSGNASIYGPKDSEIEFQCVINRD